MTTATPKAKKTTKPAPKAKAEVPVKPDLCPGSGQGILKGTPKALTMPCSECGAECTVMTRHGERWIAPHPPPSKPPAEERVVMVPIWEIVPDPKQPRKRFDLASILSTLTDDDVEPWRHASVEEIIEATRGDAPLRLREDAKIHEPLIVRPDPGTSTLYMIVEGERRWRSAKLTCIEKVPAIIRDIRPAKVFELQVLHGCTKAALEPLEIADAVARIVDEHPKRPPEDIARRCGLRSARAVNGYLALSRLCPEARAAFEAGEIGRRRADMIATMADPKEQAEILKRAKGLDDSIARMYVEQAHRRLVMADCHFDPSDPKLPGAACSACPKNTATQRALFSDLEGKDERCTDRQCFEAKQDATWQHRVKQAEKLGIQVIDGAEAKALFKTAYSGVSEPWIDLDEDDCEFDPSPDEQRGPRSWRIVLGSEARPTAIVRNPHNRNVHELLSQGDAAAALRRAGLDEQADEQEKEAELHEQRTRVKDDGGDQGEFVTGEQYAGRREREREIEERAHAMALEAVVARAEVATFEAGLRTLLSMRIATVLSQGDDSIERAASRRGLVSLPLEDPGNGEPCAEALRQYLARPEVLEHDLLGLLLELEVYDCGWNPWRAPPADEAADIALRFAGVEWSKLLEQARAERDAPLPEPKAEDIVYLVGRCSVCGCTEEEACERHAEEIVEWTDATASRCRSCAADCEGLLEQIKKAGAKGLLVETALDAFDEEDHEHIQACFKRLSLDKKAEERRTGKGVKWFALSSC